MGARTLLKEGCKKHPREHTAREKWNYIKLGCLLHPFVSVCWSWLEFVKVVCKLQALKAMTHGLFAVNLLYIIFVAIHFRVVHSVTFPTL